MNMERLFNDAQNFFSWGYTSADCDLLTSEYNYSAQELEIVLSFLKAMEYGFRSGFISAADAE